MDEFERRLVRCFGVVFPDLDEAGIQSATMGSTATWDSVATVTLVSVIEEEFGFQLDLDHIEEFVSFAKLSEYLRRASSLKL